MKKIYFLLLLIIITIVILLYPKTKSDVFCGGIANIPCPSGYTCKLDGKYPDAGGSCLKKVGNLKCKIGGCSNELCLDANSPDVASICIYKDEYACYQYSVCEIQSQGNCGWTQTPNFLSCIQNIPRLK